MEPSTSTTTADDAGGDVAQIGPAAVDLSPDTPNAPDPLDVLLAVGRRIDQITEDVTVKVIAPAGSSEPTVSTTFTVRVLSSDEIEALSERCTRYVAQGRGPKVRQTDNVKLQRLIVATATMAPKLDDPRLLQKFGAREAAGVVQGIMLPGQVAALSDKIMEVSGYDDDVVEAAKG